MTYVYRAEINVKNLKISFSEPSLTIEGIEATDKINPSLNALEIGKIRFALLWDSLLRAKVVVKESSITGLGLQTPRKRPGKVWPPEPPALKPDLVLPNSSAISSRKRPKNS